MPSEVLLECPICHAKDFVTLNGEVSKNEAGLTKILVPKKLLCKHTFQVFVDKNYKVRSYQKIDLELTKKDKVHKDNLKGFWRSC